MLVKAGRCRSRAKHSASVRVVPARIAPPLVLLVRAVETKQAAAGQIEAMQLAAASAIPIHRTSLVGVAGIPDEGMAVLPSSRAVAVKTSVGTIPVEAFQVQRVCVTAWT